MLYHLFRYLDEAYDFPGSGMFQYISFRAAAAIILALLIVIIFGRTIIDFLRRKQIGEEIRDLGLEGQLQKRGTPTMGGVIILIAILIPTLLFGRLDNVYVQLMLVSTVWLGLIGGLDDYIKVFRHRKEGLKGRFKIVGQVGLGIIVGTTMWLSGDIVVREKTTQPVETVYYDADGTVVQTVQRNVLIDSESTKTTKTTIPFVKNNEFDYGWLTGGDNTLMWLLYVLVAIFVVTAVSNGANLTDGLDGLATGVSVPIVAVLGVLAYLSGHIVYADYLNIMYIPQSGELVVFAAAFVGALVGFLWYNSFPAQIFMGDTGALLLGYVLATVSVLGLFKFYAIVTFVVPVLALAVPLSDTLFAFCRRILHGQSPFHADRGHFHHKLMDLGLNQKQAVAILYAISATLGLAAVVLTTKGTIRIALLILALLIGFVVCAFIRKSVHKHHLDVELQEAKAAAEAETAAAAENTAPVQEGNDEQTH